IEERLYDSDIKDIFNKVYKTLNIISVIESNITEFDNKKLISFHNALLELGNIYQNRFKQDNLIDIYELILKHNVNYKEFALTNNNKKVLIEFLDGYFSNK